MPDEILVDEAVVAEMWKTMVSAQSEMQTIVNQLKQDTSNYLGEVTGNFVTDYYDKNMQLDELIQVGLTNLSILSDDFYNHATMMLDTDRLMSLL